LNTAFLVSRKSMPPNAKSTKIEVFTQFQCHFHQLSIMFKTPNRLAFSALPSLSRRLSQHVLWQKEDTSTHN